MKCPRCPETDLLMAERQGVEIDYCPKCRGVWLDRGELDKIVERSFQAPAGSGGQHEARSYERRDYEHGHDGHHHKEHNQHYGHRKHKSWLSEIFD